MNSEPPVPISAGEARFERGRQTAGLFLAPLLFVVIWFLPIPGLAEQPHRLLAILAGVVTLWVTEALPLPITALLGPAVCVLFGVGPERDTAKEVFRSFADPIIFLFLGSFLLAEAMLHHGFNRRVAFHILGWRAVSATPARLLAAFAAITGFISMWVSNTATTAMMFPIAVAILREMARRQGELSGREVPFTALPFGTGLMLVTAYAASVGGMGTPVGTPPNLIGLGQIQKHLGVRITFFEWMTFAAPLAAVIVGFCVFHLNRACRAAPGLTQNSAEWLQTQKRALGPLTRGERNVLLAFGMTVSLWLLPGVLTVALGPDAPAVRWLNRHIPESIAALLGALLLFALPVNWSAREFTLGWAQARRIDWGTILLFGGGLALGELMFTTGLATWMGEGLAHGLRAHSQLGLVALFTAVAIFLSETTSNTAAATMIVPVAIAVAQAARVDPLPPALGACLGASMGFMLPVSTPPNAIVYGSGCIPLVKMIRHGLLLDLFGFAVIVPFTTWVVPWLLRR